MMISYSLIKAMVLFVRPTTRHHFRYGWTTQHSDIVF